MILSGPTTLLHKVGEFKFSRATRNMNQVCIVFSPIIDNLNELPCTDMWVVNTVAIIMISGGHLWLGEIWREWCWDKKSKFSVQVADSWQIMHFYNLDKKYDSFSIRLRFHPTGKIGFSDSYVRPLSEDLVTIPAGSVLFQVYLFAPSLFITFKHKPDIPCHHLLGISQVPRNHHGHHSQVFALDKPEELGGRETRIADLVFYNWHDNIIPNV